MSEWVAWEQENGTPGMGINTLIGVGNVNPLSAIFPKLGPTDVTLWAAAIGHSSLHNAVVARQSDDVVLNSIGGTGKFLNSTGEITESGEEILTTDHFNVSPVDCTADWWILGINFPGDEPVANFSGTPLSGASPLEVDFTDLSSNTPTSWHWEKNDGSGWVDFDDEPTAENPTEIFTTGTWDVRLTACNINGCTTHTKNDYIEVAVVPAAAFSGTPLAGCSPLEVTFTDESTNSPTSWHWEKNDGSGWVDFDGDPTEQNPVETFATGTWAVRLTASNVAGSNMHTENAYVVSALEPVAEFSGTPLTGCAPLSVAFTDESTNTPTAWLWEKNDGSGWVNFSGTPTAQNPTEDFAAGTWDVRLTATNACSPPNILVTGTFTPPEWVWDGTVLDQDFDDDNLDLTLAETITFINVTGIAGNFFLDNGDQEDLTSVDITGVTEVTGDFFIDSLPAFTTLTAPDLQTVGHIGVSGCPAVVNMSTWLANLTDAASISFGGDNLTHWPDLGNLQTCTGFICSGNDELISVPDLDALTTIAGNLSMNSNGSLVTPPDFPVLTSITGSVAMANNSLLQRAPEFPNLATVGSHFNISTNSSLAVAPVFGSLLAVGGNFDMSGCALPEADVDAILVLLANLDGTGGTTSYDNHLVDLSGGTNAPPGAAGLAAKTTLEGRGNTVTVNP